MNRGCYIVLVRLDLHFFALDSELTMSLQKWERFKCDRVVSIVTSLVKSTGCIIYTVKIEQEVGDFFFFNRIAVAK